MESTSPNGSRRERGGLLNYRTVLVENGVVITSSTCLCPCRRYMLRASVCGESLFLFCENPGSDRDRFCEHLGSDRDRFCQNLASDRDRFWQNLACIESVHAGSLFGQGCTHFCILLARGSYFPQKQRDLSRFEIACLLACLRTCLHACSFAYVLACLFACACACLLACVRACWFSPFEFVLKPVWSGHLFVGQLRRIHAVSHYSEHRFRETIPIGVC